MPEQYLYLLVINTPGRKQEMHILPSRKQRSAYKAQHEEWHLINQYLNK